MFEYRKLKGKIKEVYNTQESFAEALGISLKSVSWKLNGKSSFSQKDIITWSEKLGINSDEYGIYFFA